jgi:RHS repeat-associated protein
VTNRANKRITYMFDAVGQPKYIVEPEGGRFTTVYDAAGRISQLINPQSERSTWTHDVADRVTIQRLANGARASYSYDDADQTKRLANIKSDGTTISSFDYRYDAAGNRDRLIESSGVRVTWTYDNTYQLTREQRGGANSYDTTYVYDAAAGNRTLKIDGGVRTTSAYNATNEIRYLHDSSGRTTFMFDANGNQRVEIAPAGARTTNTWGYENRLTKVELPTGVRNTMAYDPDGLRVKLEDSTGTKKFLWDQQNYLLETDGADLTQVVYTQEPSVYGNLISQRRAGSTKYHHFDALGSTTELTDSAQAVTDSYLYRAFGELLAASGTTVNPFRYVGRLGYYRDADLADYYVRARTYRPTLARWFSRDPLLTRPRVAWYGYAQNRPILLVDMTGRAAQKGDLSKCCCPLDEKTDLPKKCDSFDPLPKGKGCNYGKNICFAVMDLDCKVRCWSIDCICKAYGDSDLEKCMRGCLQCIFDNNGGITPNDEQHRKCFRTCCEKLGDPPGCGLGGLFFYLFLGLRIEACIRRETPGGVPKGWPGITVPPAPVQCKDGKLILP